MFRAVVEGVSRCQTIEGKPLSISVYVRYRGKKTIFLGANVKSNHRDFAKLCQLRRYDELYASPDGEEVCNISRNPWWKRLWLWATW